MPYILGKTVSETFLKRIQATPRHVGFQFKPTYPAAGVPGAWREVTYQEFGGECRLVSYGLMALGIRPGDHVAVLSQTRYEWALCDMAILGAGAVTVPVYASNTPEDVAYILRQSESRVVIVENDRQLAKILEKRTELPLLEKIITIEPFAIPLAAGLKDTLTLQALKELGRREERSEPGKFESNLSGAQPEDLITLCYTSGTTGIPKGVMLTHDNMMSVLEDCVSVGARFIRSEKETVLSFLPYSHIIGKSESLAAYTFGWRTCYAESMEKIPANLEETRPTLVFSVPRVFEKAYSKIQEKLKKTSAPRRKLFDWAVKIGKERSVAALLGHPLARKLVFSKIREGFGGRLRYAICAGAPLPADIGEFFHIAGITVLEAYGLTETCGAVTLVTPDKLRYGTVGRPLPEVSIKLADDGEILVKSRKVFKGYYKLPEETAKNFTDGWLRTGDIGRIDGEGRVVITDRKKDIIITSGGKNIAPQKIESLIKSKKFINQVVVHGDRRNYLTALITLDREQVIQFAAQNQILFSAYPELIRNAKIQSLIQSQIDEVNATLPSFETIKKFILLPDDFAVETGELTPSLKVKRGFVSQKYQTALDSMYGP